MPPWCFLTASSSVRMELGQRDRHFVELLEVVVEELGDPTLLLGLSFQCIQVLLDEIRNIYYRLDLLGCDPIGVEDP
jgi:hypothetical protein